MGRVRKINNVLILASYLVAAVCAASGTTAASDVKKQQETNNKKIVARVNGRPIYEEQLTAGVEKGLKKFKKYGMRQDAPAPALVKRLQRKALDKVIDEELIAQASQKQTIAGLAEKIEQKVQAMRDRYQSQEQFEGYLKARNLTLAQLRESLKARIYLDEYLKKQGIAEPEIPEQLIRDFYDSNPDSYYRDESIKVSHILIKVAENAGPEDKEKARQKAAQIRQEILGGKDFGEMAKKYSECNSASGGGNLSYIKKGYMPEEFDRVAFALEKGAVSDVVATKFGYHIIKVFEKIPAGVTPFPEVKDFIKKFLQGEESKKKLDAHLAKLKENARIEILLDES